MADRRRSKAIARGAALAARLELCRKVTRHASDLRTILWRTDTENENSQRLVIFGSPPDFENLLNCD